MERKIDYSNISVPFLLFFTNLDNIENNLNKIKFSLDITKDLLECNPDLIKDFDKLYESDGDNDLDERIEQTKNITINQYYILLISYFEEFLNILQFDITQENNDVDSLSFSDIFKMRWRNKYKYDFICKLLGMEIVDKIENYHELRNAIAHNFKIKANFINKLKKYLDNNNKVILNNELFENLLLELFNLSNEINDIAINKYPFLKL